LYALPLIGQQLAIMQILRGEALQASALVLCTVTTLLALVAVFWAARRVYESERLAINA
jgi:sodium transport system permease protein